MMAASAIESDSGAQRASRKPGKKKVPLPPALPPASVSIRMFRTYHPRKKLGKLRMEVIHSSDRFDPSGGGAVYSGLSMTEAAQIIGETVEESFRGCAMDHLHAAYQEPSRIHTAEFVAFGGVLPYVTPSPVT